MKEEFKVTEKGVIKLSKRMFLIKIIALIIVMPIVYYFAITKLHVPIIVIIIAVPLTIGVYYFILRKRDLKKIKEFKLIVCENEIITNDFRSRKISILTNEIKIVSKTTVGIRFKGKQHKKTITIPKEIEDFEKIEKIVFNKHWENEARKI